MILLLREPDRTEKNHSRVHLSKSRLPPLRFHCQESGAIALRRRQIAQGVFYHRLAIETVEAEGRAIVEGVDGAGNIAVGGRSKIK
jgi:hypothetical protein